MTFFSSRVEVDEDIYIYFEIYGTSSSKHKILFINGMNTAMGGWLPQIEYFKNLDDYQICCYANRGISRSSEYNWRTTTSMFAKDAKKLVEYLGWDKFHIVGMSMGGMVAQEMALLMLHEGRIKSITLCGTYSHCLYNIPGPMYFYNFYAGTTIDDKIINNMFSKKFIDNNHHKAIEIYHQKIEKDYKTPLYTMVNQLCTALTHYVSEDRLKDIKNSGIQVFVCVGSSDTVVHPHNSLYLMEILEPKKTAIYINSGHAFNLEHPDEFNKDLKEFIDQS